MGTWDELDTQVNVSLDTSELDELIQFLDGDPVFTPAIELAEKYKKGIENGAKEGAETIAKRNKSLQELAIATNGTIASMDLINSIEIEELSDTSYLVGTSITHFYPLCVEKGRAEVRPVNAKVLHWFTLSGNEVFSMYSSPAPPRPFVKPAYEQTQSEAQDIVEKSIFNQTIQ